MRPQKKRFILTTSAVLLVSAAFAENGTWNTTTSPSSWATPDNWVGNTLADGPDFSADFNTLNLTANTTVNLDGNRTIGSLVFGDTDVSSAANWVLAAGSGGNLTLAGAAPTITVNTLGTGRSASITATVEGSSGFVKSGNGTLVLNYGDTPTNISGPVVISNGTLTIQGKPLTRATSLALNAGSLVIASTAANALGGSISLTGGTLQYNVSNPGTDYSAQFSAAPSQQYRVNIIANQTVTFSSNLTSTGGTLTKSGVGTLVLAGANTFTGNTIVTAGNLGLSNALALQNSNLDTNASGSGNATRGLVLNPGVTSLTFGGLTGNKTLASLFNTTSGNYSSATNVTLNPGAGASYSYAAAIANGAPGMTLTKSGEGTQILTVANTHTGGTLLSGGTLNYGNATALSSGPLSFTANSTLQAGVATTLANAVNIATGVTGTLDTVGFATTLNGTLTGNGSLTKVGNGTLTIAGGGAGNTLAGSITVTAGTLGIDSINPAPTISSFANMNGAITIASGATLNFSQSFLTENLDNDITLNGSGTGGLGALNLWRNANATGTLTLASDASISHTFNTATISGPITGTNRNLTLTTLTANQPGMTVSGPIQLGTGGITVAGVANTGNFSIRLSGSNVYSGDTSVTSGTLMLSGAARLHDSSTVRISTGAILHLDFTGNETVGALVLNNAAQANGTYGSSTSAATNKSAFFLGDGVLQVGAAPANNYAAWAGIQQPPVTGAANGDDDNDGVQNLVEYALADGAERGSFNANTLTFTKRGAPFGSDLTYIIETSTTLAADSWVAAVTHGPAQLGSVISYELATSPSTPRIFARLRVVQNP